MSLAEAVRQDRLADFIAQEEARGIGPADETPFLAVVKGAVKAPQSEDQTSHSPCGDDLTGK
jgi:hypothetical protein